MIGTATALCATPTSPNDHSRLSATLRVATIGHRIAISNVGQCHRTAPLTGLLLHHVSAYDENIRATITQHYHISDGFGVLDVVEKSAADTAGVISGDEIIAINALPLSAMNLPELHSKASYNLIETFSTRLTGALRRGQTTLTIRRRGETHSVILEPQIGCSAPVVLVTDARPDAWSDENNAAVTQGLVNAAGDDELAFAIAHEMAHVILAHAAQPHGPLVKFGIGGKRSRQREFEADRLGIIMTLQANYHEDGAEAFLTRISRIKGSGLSLTHPSLKVRLDAIQKTAANHPSK